MTGSQAIKRPAQWSDELGWIVHYPTGWNKDSKPWDEPITQDEFFLRLLDSDSSRLGVER